MSDAYLQPNADLSKLTVTQLQAALKAERVKVLSGTVKADLIKLLTEAIRPENAAKGSKGDSIEKTDAAGANGGNAEKTDPASSNGGNSEETNVAGLNGGNAEKTDPASSNGGNSEETNVAGLNGGNAKKTDTAESSGGKTDGTSKKGSVRNLIDNNAPAASETGDDNIDDEFEQALAKLKQTQIGSNSEDDAKRKLSEAKKNFVELSKSGAPIEDLNKSLEAIEKLKSLSQPKKYDQKGYVIYNPPSNPAILLHRVIWTDVEMKRAMISCGPPKTAIWRVVSLAEARAYKGFAEAADWSADRLKEKDTSSEKPTPAEARQIIGVAFARPIVVGLSMDRVFEKRSPKSREDKVKSLPANAAKDVKDIVANKHRRHVHIIISYERSGVWFQKHAPFTHWIHVAGLKEPAGLDLVKSAAAEEQTSWEAWLEAEHPDSYKQLEESGLEFESEDEKMLQDSRDNTPESGHHFVDILHGRTASELKEHKSVNELQDSRDNTPESRENSRESTLGIPTPETHGSTPDDTSDKGTNSANIAQPTTEPSDS